MNKITFILSLVSLSLTVASASAAQNNNSNEIVQLPAFRVEASRYTDAEQKIEDGLAELRNQAATPRNVKIDAPVSGSSSELAKQQVEQDAANAKQVAKALTLRPATRS